MEVLEAFIRSQVYHWDSEYAGIGRNVRIFDFTISTKFYLFHVVPVVFSSFLIDTVLTELFTSFLPLKEKRKVAEKCGAGKSRIE